MIATVRNMRNFDGTVFAWSPRTGEEASADPLDYFWLAEDEALVDSKGSPMHLARRVSSVELVAESELKEKK